MLIEFKATERNLHERTLIGQILSSFEPKEFLGTEPWAESRRVLSKSVTSDPGPMDCSKTPWMSYVMDCLDNPKIKIIVARKSAQISWTETINNYIGKTIELNPRNICIGFPKVQAGRDFYKEKLKSLLTETPVLKKLIPKIDRYSYNHIPFPGGFISLVTTRSPSDLKSSVIAILILEEPDDVKENIGIQGDSIAVFKQRLKSFPTGKIIYGGTPTRLGLSQVDRAYTQSNRMVYKVPCHHCGDFHTLSFDNLHYLSYEDRAYDEIYGIYDPTTAYYQCPNCKDIWDFEQKNLNVKEAINFFNKGWSVTNPKIEDVHGFAFNELLSSFKASDFIELAKLEILAKKALKEGKEGLMVSYTNNSKGEVYTPPQLSLEVKALKKLTRDYVENIVPYGGLILTAGIDVQHDRFAKIVRAWGRDGNSWLVHWEEIHGNVLDYHHKVWEDLQDFISQKWEHITKDGRYLKIAATSIDCSDGHTAELVYRFVMQNAEKGNNVLATKGVGLNSIQGREIYNVPITPDFDTPKVQRKKLSETIGVNVFLMGAHKAHSEILRRLNLTGNKDKYYHCKTAYKNYEEGILSCVQKTDGSYIVKPGKRKEVIDCEKMAMHAFYSLGGRLYNEQVWANLENQILYSNKS